MNLNGYLLVLLVILSKSSFSDVIESVTYKTYIVEPKNGESLSASIYRSSPIRDVYRRMYYGYTSTDISWAPKVEKNGHCYVKNNTVRLTAEITLPVLVSTDSAIKSDFQKYVEALRHHELGHLKIARDVSNAIDKNIMTLKAMSRCSSLERAADLVGFKLLEESKQESRRYDESTQHGRTQGVSLPKR